MADCTERNRCYIADRGGQVILGEVPATLIQWGRVRDDISTARVVAQDIGLECRRLLANTEPVRHELLIYRGGDRVWEGPITRIADSTNGQVELNARDVCQWLEWAIYFSGYDDRYPNCRQVTERVEIMFERQLERFEQLEPPINVLQHAHIVHSPDGPRQCRELLKHQKTCWEELESFARYSGIDYTTVGRRIAVLDTHEPLGRTQTATAADFLGDLAVSAYGLEFATFVSATDGEGHYGWVGGNDPYYGRVEKLYTVREEGDSATDSTEPPSRQALIDSAERQLEGRNPVPVLARVPDNTSVNPNSDVLGINNLVPCVRIPLRVDLTLRTLSQVQKLDTVTVVEDASGEDIRVTMSPAPEEESFPEGDDLTDPESGEPV